MNSAITGLLAKTGQPVPLTGVSVRGDITGRAARVTVSQHFENRSDQAIEAVYRFPLPEGAAINGFRAQIGDRTIRGRVEERDQAYDTYDKALEVGDGAYLLDQERPNIFTLSAGNLNPRMCATIEISYVHLLDNHGHGARFFLPTTISPRYVSPEAPDRDGRPAGEAVNPPFALEVPYGLKLDIFVHDPAGVESVSSPSHTLQNSFEKETIHLELSGDSTLMDRDLVVDISWKKTFASRCLAWKSGMEAFAQIDFNPGELETADAESVREVIFILDCSGSMAGSSIFPAIEALGILLKALPLGTYFNLYRFGNHFESLWKAAKTYDDGNYQKAASWLEASEADMGGTEVMGPLSHIYTHPAAGNNRSIILITDGEIGNEHQVAGLCEEHTAHTRVFTVGIGHGPNEYLIKRLARVTGGASEMIAPGERIEPPVLRLFRKVMGDALSGLTVNWWSDAEQAPSKVTAWGGTTTTIFARFKVESVPAEVTLTAAVGRKNHVWTLPVTVLGGEFLPLPVLWARERIRELEENSRTEDLREEAPVSREVIALGKSYGLLSGSTSYVAVEERGAADRTPGEAVLVKVPVMVTRGWHGIDAGLRGYLSMPTSSAPLMMDIASAGAHVFSPPLQNSVRRPSKIVRREGDLLLRLLALQLPAGGFRYDKDVADACAVGVGDYKAHEANMQCARHGDKVQLLWTAFVLEILRQKFNDREDEWRGVVRKSESWLVKQVEACQPTLEGKGLREWAAGYVRGLAMK